MFKTLKPDMLTFLNYSLINLIQIIVKAS